MTDVKHLSNKELVDELLEYTPQVAQCERCDELGDEILRRLNEPWRAIKEEFEAAKDKKLYDKLAQFKKEFEEFYEPQRKIKEWKHNGY